MIKLFRKIRLILTPFVFLFPILIVSCTNTAEEKIKVSNSKAEIVIPELQSILDSSNVEGAILIYDKQKHTFYSNSFVESKIDYLPASTFKIPNSIIGLELGILENEHSLFKWDGSNRFLPVWEQDLTLKDAFQTSCVPCYQELARNIGPDKMKEYVDKLNFGNMQVSPETIDNFWLMGSSKISPLEQIDFLQRLDEGQLPISKSTFETIQNILEINSTDSYALSGKTGLAIHGEKDVGWFVGYVKKKGDTYYFASKISPKSEEMDRDEFNPLREIVSIKALKELEIIE